ncbi:MAG: efflux RND transporter periplasmic adaptor subunit [Candidatus Omnitrophica bacterium]|nr:efflux RND transporter periplasmic adaptor subunit [Candidatus Omnitrophota bacterium]
MNKRIYMLFVVLVALSLAGCGKEASRKKEERNAIPVKVMKIKNEDVKVLLEYVGNIVGQDEAQVYPKVSGKIIEKVKDEGNAVTKGEAIAYVDRDEVGLKFEKAPIESPLTGVIGRVYVDIGSSVGTQTSVALVTDIDKVEIDLNIPERYLPSVSEGQDAEITVDAYPRDKFIGKVTMISPVCDLQTRAAPVQITIENKDHRLQSGMFAKVKLILDEHKGVPTVLKEAILGKAPDTYAYVIKDNKASLKKVKLGIRQGPYYEVKEGLVEGDTVVVMGQQRLREGSLVQTEE